MKGERRDWRQLLAWLLTGLLLAGCAGQKIESSFQETEPSETSLPLLGYAVQVGAFTNLDNAVRLMASLQGQGLEAYYFKHSSGLFKVRFGDFTTRDAALQRATALQKLGVIDTYYIVMPKEYAVANRHRDGNVALRKSLVETAEQFLGIPYKWGGESAEDGFDCSGLAMTVYRLNGMNLPRNSRQQYRTGRAVRMGELRPGDLIFFATRDDAQVNHVGIYLGGARFIHAPKTDKTIRIASLDNTYFVKRYRGGRTYLGKAPAGDNL